MNEETKRGRKPKGDAPMTGAERQRRLREERRRARASMLHFDANGKNIEDLDMIAKVFGLTREEVCADLLNFCLDAITEALKENKTERAYEGLDAHQAGINPDGWAREMAEFRRSRWKLYAKIAAEGQAGDSVRMILKAESKVRERLEGLEGLEGRE